MVPSLRPSKTTAAQCWSVVDGKSARAREAGLPGSRRFVSRAFPNPQPRLGLLSSLSSASGARSNDMRRLADKPAHHWALSATRMSGSHTAPPGVLSTLTARRVVSALPGLPSLAVATRARLPQTSPEWTRIPGELRRPSRTACCHALPCGPCILPVSRAKTSPRNPVLANQSLSQSTHPWLPYRSGRTRRESR
jgi:hypothetical protein